MARRLRPFGYGGTSIGYGDLAHHIGWIEALATDEEENLSTSGRGPKAKRHELVTDALDKLNQALDMGPDEDR
jgi:hypothetical protein